MNGSYGPLMPPHITTPQLTRRNNDYDNEGRELTRRRDIVAKRPSRAAKVRIRKDEGQDDPGSGFLVMMTRKRDSPRGPP